MASEPHTERGRVGMSWEQMQAATDARERAEFRATTPGQRIERVLRLTKDLASSVRSGPDLQSGE